jgi:hypothetical protein
MSSIFVFSCGTGTPPVQQPDARLSDGTQIVADSQPTAIDVSHPDDVADQAPDVPSGPDGGGVVDGGGDAASVTDTSSDLAVSADSGAPTLKSHPPWVANISGATWGGGHEVSGIAVDSQGFVYVTGSLDGEAVFGTTPVKTIGWVFFVAKYDPSGTPIWVKLAPTNSPSAFTSDGVDIAIDASDQLYVLGHFWGTVLTYDKTKTLSYTSGKSFVLKLDNQGKVIWTKQFGKTDLTYADDGEPNRLRLDANGYLYLTGRSTFGNWWVNPKTNTSTSQVYVAKMTQSNGQILWSTFSDVLASTVGAGDMNLRRDLDLALTQNGDLYLAGTYAAAGKLGSVSLPDPPLLVHSFVAGVSSSGAILWAKYSTGAGKANTRAVATGSDGSAILVGDHTGEVSFGSHVLKSTSSYTDHAFVVSVSPQGQFTTAKQLSSSESAQVTSIAVGLQGELYIAGTADGGAKIGTHSIKTTGGLWSDSDVFVAKITTLGLVDWTASGGSTSYDYVLPLAVTPNGSLFAGGRHKGAGVVFEGHPALVGPKQLGPGKEGAFLWSLGTPPNAP